MTNINKNTLIIVGITLVTIVGGAVFFLNRTPSYQKESLTIEQDLTPIELTQEEQQALEDAGLTMPFGEDTLAQDLRRVRSSDELDAILADINETNLSGLDAELDTIQNNLSGL